MATILRVRTTLTYGSGGPGLNTVYWLPGTTGGITADATDSVARVRAFFAAIQGAFANTFTANVQTDVAQINDTTGALVGSLSAAAVGTVVGTAAGGVGPLANMALARLRTGVVAQGRLIKGRWYLGPISVTAQGTGGLLSSTQITAITNAGNAMLSGGATTSVPVVWHRPKVGFGGVSAQISSVSCWDQIAVMRSRRDA